MTLKRFAARRDENEGEIIDALKRIGVQCWQISGAGVPDLLTWRQGIWLPIEVKSPGGELTVAQLKTIESAPFPVVETVEQALVLFGVKI